MSAPPPPPASARLPPRNWPVPCLGGPHNGSTVPYEGHLVIAFILYRRRPPLVQEEPLQEARDAPIAVARQRARYKLTLEPAGSWAYLHQGTEEEG